MSYSDKILNAIRQSEFRQELEELISITEKLKNQSSRIFVFIFLSICSLVVTTYFHNYVKINLKKVEFCNDCDQYAYFEIVFWFTTLAILMLAIIVLFQFNKIKKKGLVIYDELTEELDWSHKRKEFIRKPPIETRIIIKDFLQSTDLPFTSGQNGQAFYLILIFLMIGITVIAKSL